MPMLFFDDYYIDDGILDWQFLSCILSTLKISNFHCLFLIGSAAIFKENTSKSQKQGTNPMRTIFPLPSTKLTANLSFFSHIIIYLIPPTG